MWLLLVGVWAGLGCAHSGASLPPEGMLQGGLSEEGQPASPGEEKPVEKIVSKGSKSKSVIPPPAEEIVLSDAAVRAAQESELGRQKADKQRIRDEAIAKKAADKQARQEAALAAETAKKAAAAELVRQREEEQLAREEAKLRAAAEKKAAEEAREAEIERQKQAGQEDGEAIATPAASTEYVLQAGDQIDIQVYREPELSGTFSINSAGDIRHSLAGAIPMAGKTVKEAEAYFTKRLAKDYLVNPRLIIKVVSAQGSQIVLLGAVEDPGVYPLPPGQSMTLLQAIAAAGGFTDLASPDRVVIVRKTPDGQQVPIRVRVSELLKGKGNQRDIPLEPNDVITVPEIIF